MSDIFGQLSNILFGQEPTVKTGSQSTFTPEQTALFNELIGRFRGIGNGQNFGQDSLRELSSGQGINDLFQNSVANPLIKQFKDQILPGLDAKNASNLFSTEASNTKGRAGAGLMDALASNLSNMQFQGRLSAATPLYQGGLQQALQGNQLLAMLLGIPQKENYAVAQGGTPGLLGGIASGLGMGVGSGLGGKIGSFFL